MDDDEVVVETAYQPDPVLWEPDVKTRNAQAQVLVRDFAPAA